MNLRIIPYLILGLFACIFFPDFKTARAGGNKSPPTNLIILGLDISDCTVQEIYSKLGPTIPIRDDVYRLCYVSDRDETLLLFSIESSICTGLKVMSQKKRFYKWHFCEKSPLVSERTATENGIKLGMTKSRLKTILGPPQEETGQNLIYVYPGNVKITAEFSDNGMIMFDVSKY